MSHLAFNSINCPVQPDPNISSFESVGFPVAHLLDLFPVFTGTRIMMMPFYAHDLNSLPQTLNPYRPLLQAMIDAAPPHVEFAPKTTAYLTIDEMHLQPGQIQRKPLLHVDGMYQGELAGAWGGGGGGWGSCGNGMLLVSNTDDLCKMWTGSVQGLPILDGDCEHLRDQLEHLQSHSFKAGQVFWADGLCMHESYPAPACTSRQFVRISLPNNAPWFVGYTPNPLGILPSGPIIDQPRI